MNFDDFFKKIETMMDERDAKMNERFDQLTKATKDELKVETERIENAEKTESSHANEFIGRTQYLFEENQSIKKELKEEEDVVMGFKKELKEDEEKIEELIKHDAQRKRNEDTLLNSQIHLDKEQQAMKAELTDEIDRLKTLLASNNIDHETGDKIQHDMMELKANEEVLAANMEELKAVEEETQGNQMYLRESFEELRMEMEQMQKKFAKIPDINPENLRYDISRLVQQSVNEIKSGGTPVDVETPLYPDVNVNVVNKNSVFQNIKLYLPEIYTSQRIPQLQVVGQLIRLNSSKDSQIGVIATLMKDVEFQLGDSIDDRLQLMLKIQNILRNQTNNADNWRTIIQSMACTKIAAKVERCDPRDYNGLLVMLFEKYEFQEYADEKIRKLTTFQTNTLFIKPFYSTWIEHYETYQKFAGEVFHVIKRRLVEDLKAANRPELTKKVKAIFTVPKLLEFVQNHTDSITLVPHQTTRSDELLAIKSKPTYKFKTYGDKSKILGYCTACQCFKCKKKRSMKNLVFDKRVNFCRNCKCFTCNKNSKQYDDAKRKNIGTVHSADVADSDDPDLDSEVDEDDDYSTSDTAVVSGHEDPDRVFQNDFEYINSLDGEARPIQH